MTGWGIRHRLKYEKFCLSIDNKLFYCVIKHWDRLSKEMVASLSVKVFKTQLMEELGNLLQLTLLLQGPFPPQSFCDLCAKGDSSSWKGLISNYPCLFTFNFLFIELGLLNEIWGSKLHIHVLSLERVRPMGVEGLPTSILVSEKFKRVLLNHCSAI